MYVVYLILYLHPVAPEEPEDFQILVGGFGDLTFTWDPPLVTNGEIDNYTLTCSSTIDLLPMVLEATIDNVTIPMFIPGTTYTCSLRASNGGGLGSPAMYTATTLEEGRQHNTESNVHFVMLSTGSLLFIPLQPLELLLRMYKSQLETLHQWLSRGRSLQNPMAESHTTLSL